MKKKISTLWTILMNVLFPRNVRQCIHLLSMMLVTIALTSCGKRGDPKAVQCDLPDKSSYVYPPYNESA